MNRLIGTARFEQTIRKSRFIGVCGPAASEPEALGFIQTHGEPGCRHVCWAFRCGPLVRFDDAGEPGGTAGRPMLAGLVHFELDDSVVVVSRFFGGIKLGTGGLARAYGGTALETLGLAPLEKIIQTVTLRCEVPFTGIDALHRLLDHYGADKLDERWTTTRLCMVCSLPAEQQAGFTESLLDLTRGEGRCCRI
ncbi:MAG: YigZ family protein [Wenzhouxiangellaceae bacterium]|nr:YigZ family protein [Wenzhouxiangellaceae bacterium]